MKTWLSLFAAFVIVGFGLGSVHATVLPGTIIGEWDLTQPLLGPGGQPFLCNGVPCTSFVGPIGNDPVVNATSCCQDNTNTAVTVPPPTKDTAPVSTPPFQTTGSVLTWGTDTPQPGVPSFSTLTFKGGLVPTAAVPGCPADRTLCPEVGQLTYTNGTSTTDSLIFGATLKFFNSADMSSLGSMTVLINNTQNIGNSQQNEDYVNLCGDQSLICSATTFVDIPAPEGGQFPPFPILGTIVGDPQLLITDIIPGPGGVIGNNPPLVLLVLVPEPASWTVLIIGVGFIIALHLASAARRSYAPGCLVRTPSPIRANAAQ
jgi:hypothetical protein